MTELRIMTFNLRGSIFSDGKNIWENRAHLAVATISDSDPDLIGLQEAHPGNLETLEKDLGSYTQERGPRYDNKEPFAFPAILWKAERLEKLESGGFWISKTPEVYSADWDTKFVRSACWVRFREIETGKAFLCLNTHLDVASEEARVEGSRLIVDKLQDLAGGLPVVVLGDFNANFGTETYQTFINHGFKDVYLETGNEDGEDVYTIHRFTGEKQSWERRIDWILTRDGEGKVEAESCRIIRDASPPLYPSDHYPVEANIRIL